MTGKLEPSMGRVSWKNNMLVAKTVDGGTLAAAILFILAAFAIFAPQALAGIPEPGVVLFGQVKNGAGDLVTEGRLALTVVNLDDPGAGPVQLSADLEEITDGNVSFCYSVLLHLEKDIPELPLSENVVAVTDDPATYSWSAALVGTTIANSGTFELSAEDRGTAIMIGIEGCPKTAEDTDADCLPDLCEQQIADFDPDDSVASIADVNPNDDFDNDGFSNAVECQNETDPTDSGEAPGVQVLNGDLNGDGNVDLQDVAWAFDVMNGVPRQAIKIKADANGDGRIDMLDVFHILEKVAENR